MSLTGMGTLIRVGGRSGKTTLTLKNESLPSNKLTRMSSLSCRLGTMGDHPTRTESIELGIPCICSDILH
jgi:hypothetical protein